ncbi:DUF305 domain-containing protein [Nonomuraea guangzhouensis]|uniref:DUF305 domain-containing protein n=1 Tax=Nonomuraea guangzhouensis TaxID=1291555 RepID=A0ABW4GTG4_9ACTN|nr:DUF305 domain-containing protein [Nonomuraea guangzhouensis]
MRPSITATIAAGALLAAAAVGGAALAAADRQPTTTAAGWQQTGWPMGGMHRVTMDDEADYLAHMVPHHQEAVEAAGQLQHSGRAEMRALGASIVKTQTAEIATMKAWLAKWYPGRAAASYQPMMRDLSQLSGDALDRTFLEDMIGHHMAAVMMSQQLLMHSRIQHQEITGFARTVRDTQHAEIFQMQQYLTDWFDGRWRMPNGS